MRDALHDRGLAAGEGHQSKHGLRMPRRSEKPPTAPALALIYITDQATID